MWSLATTQLCCSSKAAKNKAEMRKHGSWPISLPLQNQVASRSGLRSVHWLVLCQVSGSSGTTMAKLKRSLLYTGTFVLVTVLIFSAFSPHSQFSYRISLLWELRLSPLLCISEQILEQFWGIRFEEKGAETGRNKHKGWITELDATWC